MSLVLSHVHLYPLISVLNIYLLFLKVQKFIINWTALPTVYFQSRKWLDDMSLSLNGDGKFSQITEALVSSTDPTNEDKLPPTAIFY